VTQKCQNVTRYQTRPVQTVKNNSFLSEKSLKGNTQSNEIINNPRPKRTEGDTKDHYLSDKDTPEGRVNFPTTETGDSQ